MGGFVVVVVAVVELQMLLDELMLKLPGSPASKTHEYLHKINQIIK